MSIIRSGNFYPVWPVLDGKPLSHQWGQIRQNQAEAKAVVRNSIQELGPGDSLNAARAYIGQEFGDLDFRNKYRFFFNSANSELRAQINDGTPGEPIWRDAWHIRRADGRFVVDAEGGIQASSFYGGGLQSMEEIAESGADSTASRSSIKNASKLFFNADDGFSVNSLESGYGAGSPEIKFTAPFGRAETYQKSGKVWEVNHQFGVSPLMVQVMDRDDRVIIPDKADMSDPNTAHFYFNEVFTGSVLIASGGLGAYNLRPRDPFYINIRTDEQSSTGHSFSPDANLIFDSKYFYVNIDQDEDRLGAKPSAFIGLDTGSVSRPNIHDENNTYISPPDITFANSGFYLTNTSLGTPVINLQPIEAIVTPPTTTEVFIEGVAQNNIPQATETSLTGMLNVAYPLTPNGSRRFIVELRATVNLTFGGYNQLSLSARSGTSSGLSNPIAFNFTTAWGGVEDDLPLSTGAQIITPVAGETVTGSIEFSADSTCDVRANGYTSGLGYYFQNAYTFLKISYLDG
tara:strand:+ start:1417 stop:2964 length:1548 start_codon:yes stop_codon:yes gene_type:complete